LNEIDLAVSGNNLKISQGDKNFILKNNFPDVESRYLSSQRTIEKAEVRIEKNKQGEEKAVYSFTLKTTAKFLWLFKFKLIERTKVDAETGQEISTDRSWWHIFTSEPDPAKLIENYCQKASDCQKYDDNDLCTGTLFCNLSANQCQPIPSTVVNCADKKSEDGCQANTCNPKNGKCEMKPLADNSNCDDFNFCTAGDVCQSGQCVSGANTCQCQNNSDCQNYEDGNLCNGILFCNKQNGKCELNPVTIINCQSVDDTECSKNTCSPKTGQCEMKADNIGSVCEGAHPCIESFCTEKGTCEGQWNYEKINDNGSQCQCLKNEDCQKFENGNLCDGTLYCNAPKGTCELNDSSLVYCQTVNDTETIRNLCQPETGKCVMTKVE